MPHLTADPQGREEVAPARAASRASGGSERVRSAANASCPSEPSDLAPLVVFGGSVAARNLLRSSSLSMDFVETHDPFGYVGSRVMRHAPRNGRRRQRKSTAMKPDPGEEHADGDDESDGTSRASGMILHGWLTRYDSRLDTYSLFVPNSGGVTLYSREDIMKFISNPEFVLEKDDDDAYPPPVEDTSSRFVGAPMRKAAAPMNDARKGKRRYTRRSLDAESEQDAGEWVEGRVVFYRPFADKYRVGYEDESTMDVTESEIVDALLAFAKRTMEAETKRSKVNPQGNEEVAASRKRRRSQDLTAPAEDDEETEDEEPLAASVGVKVEVERNPNPSVSVQVGTADRIESAPTDTTPSIPSSSPDTAPTEPDPELGSSVAMDDDEPMELGPLDDDDDEDMNQVNIALSSLATSTTQPLPPVETEVISLVDDTTAETPLETPQPSVPMVAGPRPVNYVVQERTHSATLPLDKRALAFKFLRTELTRLLDADECAKLETALVADVIANRDIKDRDAVRRFVETGGLVVLNTLLNARGRDALARPQARYERVLFLLKLLAMVPTPSEQQVMESGIGKTVGRLIRSRMSEQQSSPDAAMPRCIAHLAKWIKHKWIATIRRDKSAASATVAKKHLQRPTLGRPSGPRSNDPTPIPRRPMDPSAPRVESFTDYTRKKTVDVLGNALSSQPPPPKSSLKPDWMRQKETLTRTRFTINTDANAERQHYQRDRSNAATRLQGPRTPDDPGDRGVYGRTQRLSFGPRWNVCEFFKDTPPTAVRRLNIPRTNSWTPKPRPILRKTSKYRDDLAL